MENGIIGKLREVLSNTRVFQYGIVDTSEIVFSDEVRKMCEVNTCRKYGTTWACPPAVGTVDECMKKCLSYNKILAYSVKYDLEDSFDFESMTEGMKDFKVVSGDFDAKIKPYIKDYLMLSNEGCGKCESCTYPDNPCRFPESVHGSIEGYGIFVNELAKSAGINYINGPNTVTYFGALLFNDTEGGE